MPRFQCPAGLIAHIRFDMSPRGFAVLLFVLLPPPPQYPAYIREHESSLSAADLANYRKQQSCFERIVHVFDTQPQASMQIMELMNEMQQYGTPPKELVSDFMPPGFDANAPMPPGMGPCHTRECACTRLDRTLRVNHSASVADARTALSLLCSFVSGCVFLCTAGLAGLTGAGADGASGMPPMDDAFMQQLAKDDACKTQ